MLPDKLIISKLGKYCKMMEHTEAQNLLQDAAVRSPVEYDSMTGTNHVFTHPCKIDAAH